MATYHRTEGELDAQYSVLSDQCSVLRSTPASILDSRLSTLDDDDIDDTEDIGSEPNERWQLATQTQEHLNRTSPHLPRSLGPSLPPKRCATASPTGPLSAAQSQTSSPPPSTPTSTTASAASSYISTTRCLPRCPRRYHTRSRSPNARSGYITWATSRAACRPPARYCFRWRWRWRRRMGCRWIDVWIWAWAATGSLVGPSPLLGRASCWGKELLGGIEG